MTSQFLTGAAGTGKTLLLLGKIIQLFLKPSNDHSPKKKTLFITGSMDLSPVEDLFRKVGMKCITSHNVIGGHASRFGRLQLVKNASFFHDFFSNASFDIFILHQTALKDESLWPKCFHQSSTKNDIFTNLVQYLNYHTFVDDLHNYWDKLLVSYIDSSYELGYSNSFVPELVSNLKTAMKKRIDGIKSSAYLWIAFDMNQMAYSMDIYAPNISAEKSNKQLGFLLRYNRDLDVALKKELVQNQSIFRCLSRNIRNTVGISCSIENTRMHYSNSITNYQLPGKEFSKYAEKYKVFKKPGHHILGPKPRFILIENSKEQEEIVHRVICDELNKLLELGDNLCPNDVAIITDSCTPTKTINVMDEIFEIPVHRMKNFSETLFNKVTKRRVSDRDSVQASEWKAVIMVAELTEFVGQNDGLYVGLRSAVAGEAILLESVLTLYTSTLYIPLSRARVYLIVIGKLGGFERADLACFYDRFAGVKDPKILHIWLKCLSEEKKRYSMSKDKHKMFRNGEYETFKRSDFVYREVDVARTLETKPKSDGIWFDPMTR